VPVGNVLVGDSRCDIEHDDTALAVDVITITETTELLLSSSVPYIKFQFTEVGEETKRAIRQSYVSIGFLFAIATVGNRRENILNLDTQSGDVLLLELSSQMTFNKGSLKSDHSQPQSFTSWCMPSTMRQLPPRFDTIIGLWHHYTIDADRRRWQRKVICDIPCQFHRRRQGPT